MPVQRSTYIILTHDTIPPLESGPTTFFFFALKKALKKCFSFYIITIFDFIIGFNKTQKNTFEQMSKAKVEPSGQC